MKKHTALVVVDMQPTFVASNDKDTLKAVVREMEKAIENGWPIIILEYRGNGPSHQVIYDTVKAYKKHQVCSKSANDGSFEVRKALKDAEWNADTFYVVGVNSCACVRATIWGLSNASKKVYIIPDACNGPKDYNWKLEFGADEGNVKIAA